MKKCLYAFVIFFHFQMQLRAQHQPVFPGFSGNNLLQKLKENFKPTTLLPQSAARDTLFSKIYRTEQDSLTCVYTGYTIWLDPSDDPTQAAFAQGINTEHTYPQSLGAMGAAEGDMHHLFPTLEGVNADRGNLPFGEIPDGQTEDWYYLGQEISNIPATHKDEYSERANGTFEPREDHKGNVARAMFYFYTIYQAQADAADPSFFAAQRQTLCDWHYLDPVDDNEWGRNQKIAAYQSGKPNPFVLDCTLPERCYCADAGQVCEPVISAVSEHESDGLTVTVAPNPMREMASFQYKLHHPGRVHLQIFNGLGEKVQELRQGWQGTGRHCIEWRRPVGLGDGAFFYRLVLENEGEKLHSYSGKIMVLPR